MSQSSLSGRPKTNTSRLDSDEDLKDGFELPPTFECRSHNAPRSQVSSHDLGREAAQPSVASDTDLVTPAGNSEDENLKR